MEVFERIMGEGHEQVIFCADPAVDLAAIIAIHDTTLGPACGGVRMWPYGSEEAALNDVLRLSEAMTYKASLADLPLGGGKSVIIADPKHKTEAMLRSFGRFVDTLGGRYIAAPDVGTNERDMEIISRETEHVLGLPSSITGYGDPSSMTALGVYKGMYALIDVLHNDLIGRSRRISVQGFGKVSKYLVQSLLDEGSIVTVADTNPDAVAAAEKLGVTVVSPDEIYDVPCDIFAPCALGGVLNEDTIPRLQAAGCRIVAGCANNQLLTPEDGRRLHEAGILYAPDYVINAGGLMSVLAEMSRDGNGWDLVGERVERIYDTIMDIYNTTQLENMDFTMNEMADWKAQKRIQQVRKIRSLY